MPELVSKGNKKDNPDREHDLYGIWVSMRHRCSKTYETGFKNYGGRKTPYCPEGIKVCE
jgi:hypothetical protein